MTIKNKCFILEKNEYLCFGNIYNLFVNFEYIAPFREKMAFSDIETERCTVY